MDQRVEDPRMALARRRGDRWEEVPTKHVEGVGADFGEGAGMVTEPALVFMQNLGEQVEVRRPAVQTNVVVHQRGSRARHPRRAGARREQPVSRVGVGVIVIVVDQPSANVGLDLFIDGRRREGGLGGFEGFPLFLFLRRDLLANQRRLLFPKLGHEKGGFGVVVGGQTVELGVHLGDGDGEDFGLLGSAGFTLLVEINNGHISFGYSGLCRHRCSARWCIRWRCDCGKPTRGLQPLLY